VNRFVQAVFFAGTVATLGAAAPAWAQFAKPEAAVEYRQSAFTLIGNHMGRIKAQLDNAKPSLEVIRSSAALVETLKTLPFEAFVQGSANVEDSAAKPEIWTEREKFDKRAKEMQEKVALLNAAARTGDMTAIRTAFGDTGKACKNCHEDYKKKK
jgi:cytochrome c556